MVGEADYENVEMHNAVVAAGTQNVGNNAMRYFLEDQERGIVNVQLDVDSIKEEIYHLIRQDNYRLDKNGVGVWESIKDEKQKSLSDWGVDRIMQLIHFYVNRNTLLSNFNEKQINRLMYRFMLELNDLVLLKYELLFRQATFEECRDIILERMDNRKKMKMFSLEILGKEANEEEIKKELLEEIEKHLEKEIEKVREEQRKEKLREYGLLLTQIEFVVFTTLQRAWKGEERGSIRRHTTISELHGGTSQQAQQKQGGFLNFRK